jgi:hypothetical protein
MLYHFTLAKFLVFYVMYQWYKRRHSVQVTSLLLEDLVLLINIRTKQLRVYY